MIRWFRRARLVRHESFGDPAPEKITTEQAVWRKQQAERLKEDPLLKEAFATVDAKLVKAWAESGDKEERERERIWMMLGLLRSVKAHIEQVIDSGKLADHAIKTAAQESRRVHPIR